MKRISILTALIFLLVTAKAFALDPTNAIVSTTQTSTTHVEYVYNAYGVAISATDTTRTVTTTTNEKGETSTTTTVSTAKSNWRGGSLKIASVDGTSDTTSSDGSNSHTDFVTNYTYNENGQLASASGGSTSAGNRGKDANGQDIGTYQSSTTDNYIIKNGQALRSSSVTTGTNSGPDGKKTSDFTDTTNYTYELLGGSWQIVSEVSASTSTGIDGSTENVTRTRTYSRDANGVCTGISQTASGTRTAVNDTGGRTTYTMQNYQAQFAFDSKQGWYMAKESYDWVDNTPPAPPAQSADPAITGNLQLVNDQLIMVVDTITDFDGTQSGERRVVRIVAAQDQEAELEALKELVANNGGSLSGYTIYGVYQGQGADNYTAQEFVFWGIGFGPFQPK